MRETIIGSAIRHLGSGGFDVAPALEISHEADGTKPLVFYLIFHLADLPKHTATVSHNICNKIYHHFQTVYNLPEKARKIRGEIFLENIRISQYLQKLNDHRLEDGGFVGWLKPTKH